MIDAFGQAGFFAAHSIWSVSSGDTLIPILASVKINGEKKMERIAVIAQKQKSGISVKMTVSS